MDCGFRRGRGDRGRRKQIFILGRGRGESEVKEFGPGRGGVVGGGLAPCPVDIFVSF